MVADVAAADAYEFWFGRVVSFRFPFWFGTCPVGLGRRSMGFPPFAVFVAVWLPFLGFRRVPWGAVPRGAALEAGCVEPGMRKIGVPFGPMIVVARLPLRRTVPGGAVFERVVLFPPTSWVVSRSIGV